MLIWCARRIPPDRLGSSAAVLPGWLRNAQTTPVDSYVSKAINLYPYLVALSAAIFALVLVVALSSALFPRTIAWLWQRYLQPFARQMAWYLRDKKVLAASLFLGLATAIRVAGPLSGILVACIHAAM